MTLVEAKLNENLKVFVNEELRRLSPGSGWFSIKERFSRRGAIASQNHKSFVLGSITVNHNFGRLPLGHNPFKNISKWGVVVVVTHANFDHLFAHLKIGFFEQMSALPTILIPDWIVWIWVSPSAYSVPYGYSCHSSSYKREDPGFVIKLFSCCHS